MNNNNVLIYQDDNGITKVSVRFSDERNFHQQVRAAEVIDDRVDNDKPLVGMTNFKGDISLHD